MTESFLEVLARIEESVRASDGEAILARWDFGAAVLTQRVGKQLPSGTLVKILSGVSIGRQELNNRVRVAEHWDRQELSRKLESSATGWTALVAELPKKRQQGARSPKPPNPGPTAATFAEADRVQVLIVKPDVAAELVRRAATDAAAAKAAAMIERRERAEAKAQKERDREDQQRQEVLRLRLVEGGTDWGNLTDQVETMADTGRRLCRLVDGLPFPDPVWARLFDRHLAALQETLFELRLRVAPPVYDEPVEPPAEVWSRSVIEGVAR